MELQSYEAQCSEKIMERRESSRAYYSDNNCSIKMEAWRVGLSEERERERDACPCQTTDPGGKRERERELFLYGGGEQL